MVEGVGKPKKRLTGGKLGLGCLVMIGLMFGVVTIAYIVDPEGMQRMQEEQRAREEAAASADRSENALAATEWHGRIMTALQPCDDALVRLGEQMEAVGGGSADIYAGYDQAAAAQRVCNQSWARLQDFKAPEGLEDENESRAEDAIEQCQIAAMLKEDVAEGAMAIFDGDRRPSAITEVREKMLRAQHSTMSCAAGTIASAIKAGADPDTLGAAAQLAPLAEE